MRDWIDSKKNDWPPLVTSIAYKWLDEGLQDRGITRDLQLGHAGAGRHRRRASSRARSSTSGSTRPSSISRATWEWADANGKGDAWRELVVRRRDKDVRYVEFMGKDNVPFHTVGFPGHASSARASRGSWSIELKGFNWLNYDGGKFSTSEKRGVFMDTALEILPADYWRYYLMANAPEGCEFNFTWQHFAGVVNKDLADVLGNFVNRVTKFTRVALRRQGAGRRRLRPEERRR